MGTQVRPDGSGTDAAVEPGEARVGGKKDNRGLSKAPPRGREHSYFLTPRFSGPR